MTVATLAALALRSTRATVAASSRFFRSWMCAEKRCTTAGPTALRCLRSFGTWTAAFDLFVAYVTERDVRPGISRIPLTRPHYVL